MSEDPWRLHTEAAMRAVDRCFRLPVLDVAAPLGALSDPVTVLEQLLGRYLPVSEAAGGETALLPNGTRRPVPHPGRSPRSYEAAELPGGWQAGPAGAVVRPAPWLAPAEPRGRRQAGSAGTVAGEPPSAGEPPPSEAAAPPSRWPGGWASGFAGKAPSRATAELPGGWPDRSTGQDSSAGAVAQQPSSWDAGEQPGSLVRATARPVSAGETPESRLPAGVVQTPPALASGIADPGGDPASAAGPAPALHDDRSSGSVGGRPAARFDAPLVPTSPAGLDRANVVTRVDQQDRGLATAMSASHAEPVPVTRSRAAATALPTSDASDAEPQTSVTRLGRGATQLAAVLRADAAMDPVEQQPAEQLHNGFPGFPLRNVPIDHLVATVTDEVAERLRDELAWEFQRTYGIGG